MAISPDAKIFKTAVVEDGATVGAGTGVWHCVHVQSGAVIGERCVLGQNVMVAGGAKLGNNVKVQNNVAVYAGVTVEDDVFLGPSCVLTNVTNPRSGVSRKTMFEKTLIQRGATVGANATIVCGVTVGRHAMIAAGAVVTKNVPDYAMIVGVPGKQRGFVTRHGHPINPSPSETVECPETGLRYALNNDGELRCLDLAETAPLPDHLIKGITPYRDLNPRDGS
ncbi:MAG: acyltransferase [Planctomycetota bacterium]